MNWKTTNFEFSFYDWAEFAKYLDSLPDDDAAKLTLTIEKI